MGEQGLEDTIRRSEGTRDSEVVSKDTEECAATNQTSSHLLDVSER